MIGSDYPLQNVPLWHVSPKYGFSCLFPKLLLIDNTSDL